MAISGHSRFWRRNVESLSQHASEAAHERGSMVLFSWPCGCGSFRSPWKGSDSTGGNRGNNRRSAASFCCLLCSSVGGRAFVLRPLRIFFPRASRRCALARCRGGRVPTGRANLAAAELDTYLLSLV